MGTKNSEDNPIMRAYEVQQMLRIGKNTLYSWCAQNTIPHKRVGRLILFSRERIREWLWGNTTYRLGELKEKIGTSLSEIALENKMKPLIGNRIIYPDGSVNSFVE